MNTQDLNSFVCVPLPRELYQKLTERHPGKVSTVLENISWDFLERTGDEWLSPQDSGIAWKQLFLPTGTKFRMKYKGEFHQAEVGDDEIKYNDEIIESPAKLANKIANDGSVNAWKALWIKRPQDTEWVIADVLRQQHGN